MSPSIEQQLGCLAFAAAVGVATWCVHLVASRGNARVRKRGRYVVFFVALGAFIGVNAALVALPGSGVIAVVGGMLGGFTVYQRFDK
ncbi:hypothetical protein, partial [Rhodopirellula bahusiensis]|uniref:hypothetical protein n=1 Tax=Rhodopirellula bahusiensis TaxID=2014065 RepID=UPI003263F981